MITKKMSDRELLGTLIAKHESTLNRVMSGVTGAIIVIGTSDFIGFFVNIISVMKEVNMFPPKLRSFFRPCTYFLLVYYFLVIVALLIGYWLFSTPPETKTPVLTSVFVACFLLLILMSLLGMVLSCVSFMAGYTELLYQYVNNNKDILSLLMTMNLTKLIIPNFLWFITTFGYSMIVLYQFITHPLSNTDFDAKNNDDTLIMMNPMNPSDQPTIQ